MKDIEPSTKKKLIIFASVGLAFWGVVTWLFLTVPIFVIDALPQILPLSVFAFLLFLIGLTLPDYCGNNDSSLYSAPLCIFSYCRGSSHIGCL